MTAIEQIQAWAQTPNSEIFVGLGYGDNPYQVRRVKARELATGFQRIAKSNSARVEAINGVCCVVVELAMPHVPEALLWVIRPGAGESAMPHVPEAGCRMILSPVEPFA